MFQKVFQNSKILFSTEIINLVTGIATVVLLARLLNVAALGLYSFSFAVGSVLAIACLAGANQWITREIARTPERVSSLVGHSLVARSVIMVGLFFILEIVFLILRYPRERILIVSFLVMVRVLECFIFMLCAVFRGFEEMRLERRLRMCLNAINLGVGVPLLIVTRSLFVFSMTQCLLTLGVLLVSYEVVVRRYSAKPFERITVGECVAVFKEGLDFSNYMILLVVYLQTNTILLTMFKGNEAAGLYTAGFRFVSALGVVASSTIDALFPAISRLNLREHTTEITMAYVRSTKYLLVVASFASLTLFIFAPALIQLFYGKAFQPAALGLRIMAVSVIFSYINTSSSNLLFSLNMERVAIRILGMCVVFVILSNLAIIPLWGFLGASLTTVLPELMNFALQYKAICRHLRNSGLLGVLLKFGVLSAGVVAATFSWTRVPLALQIALFLVSYGAGIYVLRIFEPDEIAFIKKRYFKPAPVCV